MQPQKNCVTIHNKQAKIRQNCEDRQWDGKWCRLQTVNIQSGCFYSLKKQ